MSRPWEALQKWRKALPIQELERTQRSLETTTKEQESPRPQAKETSNLRDISVDILDSKTYDRIKTTAALESIHQRRCIREVQESFCLYAVRLRL